MANFVRTYSITDSPGVQTAKQAILWLDDDFDSLISDHNTKWGSTVAGILDEDDLASDSAVKLATQQSLKAYIDNAGSRHISGLILSNDTDTAHDINITAGKCRDAGDAVVMALATERTKKIDVVWADGNDAGGFPSAGGSGLTLSDATWYHVFLIKNPTTGGG